MSIQQLPTRVANQIAAGEVVERPASVVKELIENALDAGATAIQIDIEQAGKKLIRIRDNGSGIDKEELILALSRHATSKITTIDDLDNILSLGFRGEALASISAISHLTLISKPVKQTEAWQAKVSGMEMTVQLEPAAHPDGTSVIVHDLFFNTPARRKFLRVNKTEFQHIDEVVKRLALSRFDVAWQLKHQGKIIRKLPQCNNEQQQQKRLQTLFGTQVLEHIVDITSATTEIQLSGYILMPYTQHRQADLQYCYINGRIMRDKVIQHAIRQAYAEQGIEDIAPNYVLYIEINPEQIDINVHPAKHEVRFHQARLIHDFIQQAIMAALNKVFNIDQPLEQQITTDKKNTDDFGNKEDQNTEEKNEIKPNKIIDFSDLALPEDKKTASLQPLIQHKRPIFTSQETSTKKERHAQQQFYELSANTTLPETKNTKTWQAMALIQQHYLLIKEQNNYFLYHLYQLESEQLLQRIKQGLEGTDLLVPVRFQLQSAQKITLNEIMPLLPILGYEISTHKNYFILHRVPILFRAYDHVWMWNQLLEQPSTALITSEAIFLKLRTIIKNKIYFSLEQGEQLLTHYDERLESHKIHHYRTAIDFSQFIHKLNQPSNE